LERRLETDGEVVTEEGLEAWTDAWRDGTVKDAKASAWRPGVTLFWIRFDVNLLDNQTLVW